MLFCSIRTMDWNFYRKEKEKKCQLSKYITNIDHNFGPHYALLGLPRKLFCTLLRLLYSLTLAAFITPFPRNHISFLTFGVYMLCRRFMKVWIFLLMMMGRILFWNLLCKILNRWTRSCCWKQWWFILYMFMILKQISFRLEFWHVRYCYLFHKHYYVFSCSWCK